MMQQKSEVRRIRAGDHPDHGGGGLLPPLFELGSTVITANALQALHQNDVQIALRRHHAGDWGTVCPEDWEANQSALAEGLRILSVYQDRTGTRFYIITEADRSITTVMLPEDY